MDGHKQLKKYIRGDGEECSTTSTTAQQRPQSRCFSTNVTMLYCTALYIESIVGHANLCKFFITRHYPIFPCLADSSTHKKVNLLVTEIDGNIDTQSCGVVDIKFIHRTFYSGLYLLGRSFRMSYDSICHKVGVRLCRCFSFLCHE